MPVPTKNSKHTELAASALHHRDLYLQKSLEPVWRQLSIAHRVLNIAMPKVR
jgi:hypothetical protein